MPSRRRPATAGVICHVLNRGVRRLRLFDESQDYLAFCRVVREAQARVPVRCLGYCLMPNHFHLVLWPQTDTELSAFMSWLLTTHSKRWHAWRQTAGTGHVYQGRFKAFPVSCDTHFLRLCRYVERNAVRAGLVSRPEHWPWCSLAQRAGGESLVMLTDWPVERPPDWLELVQLDVTDETREVRHAVRGSTPYGPEEWRLKITEELQQSTSATPRPRSPGEKGN